MSSASHQNTAADDSMAAKETIMGFENLERSNLFEHSDEGLTSLQQPYSYVSDLFAPGPITEMTSQNEVLTVRPRVLREGDHKSLNIPSPTKERSGSVYDSTSPGLSFGRKAAELGSKPIDESRSTSHNDAARYQVSLPIVTTSRSRKRKTRAPAAADSGRPMKEKDYSGGIEKPLDNVKGEDGKCLTCIRYSRTCKGTTLQPTVVRGKLVYRCQTCIRQGGSGHNGRVCYWRNVANGVLTYEDAQSFHNGAINLLNRREGRIRRAAQKAALCRKSEQNLVLENPLQPSNMPPNNATFRVLDPRILSPYGDRTQDVLFSQTHLNRPTTHIDLLPRVEKQEIACEDSDDEELDELIQKAFHDLQETAAATLKNQFAGTPPEATIFAEMLNIFKSRCEGMRPDILAGLYDVLTNLGHSIIANKSTEDRTYH